ncbi:MAG: ATP-dependent RecD-like DNA helicase [Clostridiales bacterium]|nr:ATP-dependent RecD-like DNA helicase [Clostridiales bacterium]
MEDFTIISGGVEDIIFHNEENSYAVFRINCEGSSVTVVGTFPALRPGENLEITGGWITHKRYGKQFAAQSFQRNMPDKDDALVRYLSSGFVKGVGVITAQRIVEKFGSETPSILEESPERLVEIKGITSAKAMMIGNAVSSQKALSNIIMFFTKYGLSPAKGAKAYKYLGDGAVDKIKNDPYILISEKYGLRFKQADGIARQENEDFGEYMQSDSRICAGIRYVLGRAKSSGHSYLPMNILMLSCRKVLGLDDDFIEIQIEKMIEEKILSSVEECIYLTEMYNAEKYVSVKIKHLASMNFSYSEKYEYSLMESLEEMHVDLDELQTQACMSAIENGVSVISGGPGTGKTTIIKALISVFEKTGKSYKLAAPTGRAAKKMQDSSDRDARTIHRLLEIEFIGDAGDMQFAKNENNPIDADVVIIDEMSMVDIELMQSLMKAIRVGTRLILIGDMDQLPAVGPGKVLQDIIESGTLECTILKNIYRQETGSSIPIMARDINNGMMPDLNPDDGSMTFIEERGGRNIFAKMTEIIMREMKTSSDIQVISPGKKGDTGTINLNAMMQNVFNPIKGGKREKKYINRTYREGDKVMQIKNNYEIAYTTLYDEGTGVYNGDIGYLEEIDNESEKMTVVFEGGKIVRYEFSESDQLESAYAITVHKSQGSEYEVVVMPLYGVNEFLQNRNLLYTAVSRAVKRLYIIGSKDVLMSMIRNVNKKPRYSGLREMLIG